MGLQILTNSSGDTASYYNSTVMWAFGPVASGEDARTQLIAFQQWLELRPENYSDEDLAKQWSKFNAEYLPGFKAWMADRWDEVDWKTVESLMCDYQEALEESHAGGAE